MRSFITILFVIVLSNAVRATDTTLGFYGDTLQLPLATPLRDTLQITDAGLQTFATAAEGSGWNGIVDSMLVYKQRTRPDDWLYYQLIRRVAQSLAPKEANYPLYTAAKWYLLVQSGYDALLTASDGYLLLYIQSEEPVYNIPTRRHGGKQYVCLNYHDFGNIDFVKHPFHALHQPQPDRLQSFSYRITRLPDLIGTQEREIRFWHRGAEQRLRLQVAPEVAQLFRNYPLLDYDRYCFTPLSSGLYASLIPQLRRLTRDLSPKAGVELLMRFTREATGYKTDTELFGSEKRLTPEQTLLSEWSDCEDRASLFFYLVKELYDLPMVVLAYPEHVTVAVAFDKGYGQTVEWGGRRYTVCEPTPQGIDLPIGAQMPGLRREKWEVAYAYAPVR